MNPIGVITDLLALMLIMISFPIMAIMARFMLYFGSFRFYLRKKMGKLDDEEYAEIKEGVAKFWEDLYEIEYAGVQIVESIFRKYK